MTEPPSAKPASLEARSARLGDLEIFEDISPATLELVARQAQRRALAKGEILFNVGDASDALYVVTEGMMRIWTVSAAGAEVTLNVLTADEVFGEIGMLDGSVRTAGASAMAPTELLSISRRAFFDALDRDSRLARNVIALLCKRLRWASARMEDATLRQAPQRLARILGHLALDHGRKTKEGIQVSIRLTQGELAQWTAMSRESLNKTLNRWADEGILVQGRGGLLVKNLDRIDEIAEFGE